MGRCFFGVVGSDGHAKLNFDCLRIMLEVLSVAVDGLCGVDIPLPPFLNLKTDLLPRREGGLLSIGPLQRGIQLFEEACNFDS
jgi:hypothetical protein